MKEERIKVLALLPMELPKEIELDNTLEAILFSRPLHPIVLRIQITGNSGTHELFHKIFTVVTCFPCKLKEATLNVANLQPE